MVFFFQETEDILHQNETGNQEKEQRHRIWETNITRQERSKKKDLG